FFLAAIHVCQYSGFLEDPGTNHRALSTAPPRCKPAVKYRFPVMSMSVLSRIAEVGGSRRQQDSLRFVTFLAPNLFPLYEFITHHAERRLGLPTELAVGSSYAQLSCEAVDVAFVCGLPYVELARGGEAPVEPLAAPILRGERFGGRAIYFSDVIVQRARRLQSFTDLRGCSWAYNEPHSQSG